MGNKIVNRKNDKKEMKRHIYTYTYKGKERMKMRLRMSRR
jgi:hypothetical protein